MKIILHIFKKDLRHHLPEFLVSLAILAVYIWDQPRQLIVHTPEFRFFSSLLRYLPAFLMLSWVFLMVRIVHGESLVGDRQFWLTRPYRRHTLLAAKLLAALLLIHLPLFLAQLLLLKLAFFPVLASVPGLLQVQLMLFGFLTLPAFVVRTIIRSIGQASLVVLELFLVLMAMAALVLVFPSLDFSPDNFDYIMAIISFVGATSVVVIQFAWRKTRFSWFIIAGCLASYAVLLLFAGNAYIQNRGMPLPTAAHPLPARFTFDSSVSFQHQPGEQLETYGLDQTLELPFLLSDMPQNSIVQIAAIKLDWDLPSGEHWTSYWHSDSEILVAGRTR